MKLTLHKVKGYSENKLNNLVDKLVKEGLDKLILLKVLKTSLSSIIAILKWKDQIIDSLLKTFVNIVSEVTYKTE